MHDTHCILLRKISLALYYFFYNLCLVSHFRKVWDWLHWECVKDEPTEDYLDQSYLIYSDIKFKNMFKMLFKHSVDYIRNIPNITWCGRINLKKYFKI